MTPKEKAKDLVHKFNIDNWDDAKQYASICVKELIRDNKAWLDDDCQDYGVDYQLVEANIEYYEEVEKELLKL